jgi:hypothetical protein
MTPNMRLVGQDKSTQDSRQPLAIVYQNNQDNMNTMDTQNLVAKTAAKQLFAGEQNCKPVFLYNVHLSLMYLSCPSFNHSYVHNCRR